MNTLRRCGLALLTAALIGQFALAQDDGAATTTAATPPEPPPLEWQDFLADDYAWLMDASIPELKLRMTPLTKAELEQRSTQALAAAETIATALSQDLVDHLELVSDEAADPNTVLALEARLDGLTDLRQQVIAHANIVLAAYEDKGGDVTEARAYISTIEKLEAEHRKSEDVETLTAEEEEAQRVAQRVATAVAEVRAMPPVHERPEPWTVSVDELRLELQPLRKEQIDERVQKWIDILQRQVRQRVRLDIALTQAEDPAVRQALADLSAVQQETVQAIVERVKAALLLLQKRGGDTAEYEDYIANATGQRLNLTNPSILFAQLKSWLRSPSGGIRIGLGILKFLVILFIAWVVAKLAGRLVTTATRRVGKSSALLQKFLGTIVRWIILLVGFAVAVSSLGVTIGPLLAAIGAAGLVIGLALQGTLSNFASGILILISRPFDVGDVINAGGVFGKVDAMNLVSTKLLTFDNQVMLVPNNQIWNGVITNVTALKTRRVDLTFGIAYNADIAKACQILEELLKSHPKVLADPAPMIRVHELADSSVNLIVRPWSRTEDYWDVYWDMQRQVKERFDADGIGIPFPQRDVHLYSHEGK